MLLFVHETGTAYMHFGDAPQNKQGTASDIRCKLEILFIAIKDEIEGKKTSLLAQMYDRNRILVMLPIMWLNIS